MFWLKSKKPNFNLVFLSRGIIKVKYNLKFRFYNAVTSPNNYANHVTLSGDKNSTRSDEGNLERTSNSPPSSHPVGRVLWDELLEEVILHITPL